MAEKVVSLTEVQGLGLSAHMLQAAIAEIEAQQQPVKAVLVMISRDHLMDRVDVRIGGGMSTAEAIGYIEMAKQQMMFTD